MDSYNSGVSRILLTMDELYNVLTAARSKLTICEYVKDWIININSIRSTKYVGGYVDACVQFLVYGDALQLVKCKREVAIFQKYMSIFLIILFRDSIVESKSVVMCELHRAFWSVVNKMRENIIDIIDNVDNEIVANCIDRINGMIKCNMNEIFSQLISWDVYDPTDESDKVYYAIRFKHIITFELTLHIGIMIYFKCLINTL